MRSLIAIILTLVLASASMAASIENARGYFGKNDFSAAVMELEAYVYDNPDDSQGIFLLGYAYYKAGRMEEAMKRFKEAYLLDPDFTPAIPPASPER